MAHTYSKMNREIDEIRLTIEGALIGSLIVIAFAIFLEYFSRVKALRESGNN